ncbi:MAG: ABC transporter ATP-binding protein [Saprospiraceae bacterium]|nr:ABC transporter ATP-binding protein [Saprospiraceae bacterium]
MHSISVNGISKTYLQKKQKLTALENIQLNVDKGELFGLIGPDGAGKTSLIRILVTLILADEGNASVENLDVIKDLDKIRKIVGYMPGRFSLYQDLTVAENLQFFASVFNTDIQSNYTLIKEVYKYLEPFQTRKAGQLSGGMKQKLALSCALIHKPSVLFLDEPTTGVDAVSRKEFWEMLKALQLHGMTIFVSTPYMDEASLCDRVALIQNGKILQIQSPAGIIQSYPKSLYELKSDRMYQLLVDLKSLQGIFSCFAFGNSYHVVFEDQASIPDTMKILEQMGHQNIQIKPISPNIEDCFMYYMQTTK